MTSVTTTDPVRIAALCDDLVALDPVANTVFGTIAAIVREGGDGCWAVHPYGDPLVLAARSNPGTPVTCSTGWADPAALVTALEALDPPPASLGGPAATVDAVVASLGRPLAERRDERLFRLDELREPHGAAGRARLAGDGDTAWLADWYTDFTLEAFGVLYPGFDATQMVERGMAQSRCWIWCDRDGVDVSFAVRHPPVSGVARIGPVYTPPAYRGHGYGSAATAAASRDILAEGDIACLYTDLANPTSNRIYAALGYRPVTDRTFVRFA